MTTKKAKINTVSNIAHLDEKNLNSNHVTACARTSNATCHSTVDGVLENSVQDRAQAVAMATKHPDISFVCQRNSCLDAHSS